MVNPATVRMIAIATMKTINTGVSMARPYPSRASATHRIPAVPHPAAGVWAFWRLVHLPDQAERLARRVGVDAPVVALSVQPRSAERQRRLLARLDLVDQDVEMELLRVRRIRPLRRA